MTREKAYRLRRLIERAAASLSDADASMSVELFPRLKQDGSLIEAGTRVNWNGKVMRAAVDLWDTEQNDPDREPTLWAELQYRDGIRIIPQVMTAADAFAKDEKGWWGDDLYCSTIDNNVWTPVQYPQGWELIVID